MKFSITSSVLALIPIVLVIAVPLPTNLPAKPGDVVRVNHATSSGKTTEAVVLAGNRSGQHMVAHVSSSLSKTDHPHQAPASDYHAQFPPGHAISTGSPDIIDSDRIVHSSKEPMLPSNLAHLMGDINSNCQAGLKPAGGFCSYTPVPKPKAAPDSKPKAAPDSKPKAAPDSKPKVLRRVTW